MCGFAGLLVQPFRVRVGYKKGGERGEADAVAVASVTGADEESRVLAARLLQVAAGDRAALADVYRRTSAKLFGVCLRILVERSEAEEVLQEVYLAVWQKAGGFDLGRASAMTWLIVLARNKAIDRLRSRAGARGAHAPAELAEALEDPAEGALGTLIEKEGRARLMDCLEELAPEQRDAIRTAFLDGWTYERLATEAGVPLGTLKSRVRRGLTKLRACLER